MQKTLDLTGRCKECFNSIFRGLTLGLPRSWQTEIGCGDCSTPRDSDWLKCFILPLLFMNTGTNIARPGGIVQDSGCQVLLSFTAEADPTAKGKILGEKWELSAKKQDL